MRRTTRDLLASAARLYPVVVISGRAPDDLVGRLRGLPLAAAVGNQGREGQHSSTKGLTDVRRWLPSLDGVSERFPGVEIEDKGFSIAVHYRRSREKRRARAAILTAAASLPGARIIPGKQVVNVVPTTAPHKGIALERERDRLRCDTAIYVGDDRTDEDVFALDQPGRLLSVRVGRSRSSAATYAIASQRAIDDLLRTLVAYRTSSRTAREAVG
jgi:trehalose 6-phosphate phosphatase